SATSSLPVRNQCNGPTGIGTSASSIGDVRSAAIRIDGVDMTVSVLTQHCALGRAQVRHPARHQGVVIEEVHLPLVRTDGMVRGPAYDRREDHACISEGAIRVVPYRVAQQMRVAGGIRQEVLALMFVQPRPF